jgi:hypothetical protein
MPEYFLLDILLTRGIDVLAQRPINAGIIFLLDTLDPLTHTG